METSSVTNYENKEDYYKQGLHSIYRERVNTKRRNGILSQ